MTMNWTRLLMTLGCFVLCTLMASADDRDQLSLLVEPADLQARLGDDRLRILDVRSMKDYAGGHVPGAIRVDVGNWKELAIADNGLHDAAAWADEVGALGV